MPPIRKASQPGRNKTCPCGSGMKFKRCHGFNSGREPIQAAPATPSVTYIDTGEDAVRWVICDRKGTAFFSDKDNRILVFTDKALAMGVAGLEDFVGQEDGDINIAGVGPTKFAHLCEKLPYVEVSDVETAVALIRERIEVKSQDQKQDQAQDQAQTQVNAETQTQTQEDNANAGS